MQAKKLAQQINISPSYLNLIESGKRKIDGDLLLKISQELRIDFSDISLDMERDINNSKKAIANFSSKEKINELNLKIGPKIKAFRRQLGIQANKLAKIGYLPKLFKFN